MAPKARVKAKPKATVKAKAKATVKAKAKATVGAKAKATPKAKSSPPSPAKRKVAEAPPPAPAAKKASTGAASGGGGGRVVDKLVPKSGLEVVEEYSVTLNQTNVGDNNNKFYIIQALEGGGQFFAWNRWGRVGEPGQNKLLPCATKDKAIKEFEGKFRDKTKNSWANKADFKKVQGKYTIVETEESAGGGQDQAPMGKLTEQQVGKGQVVLDKLESALAKKKEADITQLSSEFYSLIPTNFGRKKPVAISTLDMLQEKQELLKFFLRMGFEQVEADAGLTPIDGIKDLPLPKSLDEAAAGTCASSSLTECNKKGRELSAKQAGNPTKPMDFVLYAAIMLYTSNAIYAELNKALRNKDRAKIKKFFKYLRLLIEAMNTLPRKKVTLWRGLSVDLSKDPQYAPGQTTTWWGVSSCTSDQKVARGFAEGCGGESTIVTVNSVSACDISAITFFSNEKESLLRPGTQLKVKSRTKKGAITEVTLEEVGCAIG